MTNCFAFMDASGMGWMMWGAGLFWLLTLVLLILAVAGLIKYLRAGSDDGMALAPATSHRGESS